MNIILRKGKYPVDFGHKSRSWFSQQTPRMIQTVKNWQRHIPQYMFYDLSKIDYPAYDRLISQLRKEFIENQTYDTTMINLIRNIRCKQDPQYIECKTQ